MKDLQRGDEVDGWRIERRIGQGSMGTVYEARQGGQRAALKVIRGDTSDEEHLARFRREARVLLSLEHPSVVRCYATGDLDGGGVYLALEFLDGGSLQDVVDRRGRLPVPQAVGATRALLSGLAVIHAQGIIHRDVKPANVLLDAQGRAKLADFGLARPMDASTALTDTGTVLGTPYYMAPEQIRGMEVGPAIDLYAAGASLYTLLTGQPPFPHDNPLKVLQAHLKDPVPDVRAKLPTAPEKLVRALDALLSKEPDDRPASAAAALALLDGLPSMFIQRTPGESTVTEPMPLPGEPAAPGGATRAGSLAMEALANARGQDGVVARRTNARVTMAMVQQQPEAPARKTQALRATGKMARPAPPAEPDTATLAPEAAAERRRRRASGDAHAPARDDLPAGPVPPRPLPPPQRARWYGRLVGLLVVLSLLHVGDIILRARGTDGLNLGLQKLGAWEAATRAAAPTAGWEATALQAAPHANAALRGLMRGRAWLDLHLLQAFGVVGVLLLERLLGRALRHGLVERVTLRRRAARLRRKGEVHQAALVYEVLGDRARGAKLLLDHGMAQLASDMFLAAGLVDEARAARGLPPRTPPAGPAPGAPPAAAAGPPGGAGARYEAADQLEKAGRVEDAIAALASAWQQGAQDGRDYWLHTGKQGRPEEARPRLARRIAELCLKARRREDAGPWFERAGAAEEARALYDEAGDHRAVARCLLMGVPAEGRLEPAQRERVEQAGRALLRANDARGVDLLLRAEKVGDAAEGASRLGELTAAVELYTRAGLPAEAAACAERQGDLARAAELWDEAEDYGRAADLYEAAGRPEPAAHAAGHAGDQARAAALYERAERPIEAAEVWARLGDGEAALRALERVPRESDRWDDARVLAGEVHHQAGRHAEAVAAYADGLPSAVIFQEQMGPQLNYAASLEAVGEFDRALEVLSRLDGKEFAPMDLNQRKGRVEQKRAGGSGTGPAASASSSSGMGPAPTSRINTPNELIGTQIASYQLLRYIGEGSFAWVFEARHATLNREAALKVLKPALTSGEAPRRFLREGRAVAGLKHPHLIEIYDAGDVNGLYYLALEFVKGPTLKKLISDEAPFPPMRAARIGAGILSGLGAAHRKNIVHRDLKPANVLVGQGMQAKVLDFGLARVFDDAGQSATAGYLGTPRYASPEQARGAEVGEAADQYAAGLVIYEMLTGRLPFESKTSLGFLALHAHEAPRPIRELKPDVPAPLADAVMRSLEKSPGDRHENVGAFERILATFLGAVKRPPPQK